MDKTTLPEVLSSPPGTTHPTPHRRRDYCDIGPIRDYVHLAAHAFVLSSFLDNYATLGLLTGLRHENRYLIKVASFRRIL
jgi:hypothetical protein